MPIYQDPEGSRLLYTISGDYFSVNPNSGEVTLIKVTLTKNQSVLVVQLNSELDLINLKLNMAIRIFFEIVGYLCLEVQIFENWVHHFAGFKLHPQMNPKMKSRQNYWTFLFLNLIFYFFVNEI